MVYCQEPNCKSEATYAFKFAEPLFCMNHGKEKKAKTQFQVCRCGLSTPRFKLLEDERVSCCAKCKTDKMVNVADRRCVCEKHLPTYGMPEDKRPEYCSECKKDGMINLKDKNKKCLCKKVIPSFGNPGDKKATCCAKCKKEGMINLILDLCPCGKSAVFGFKGDKNASFCSKCKKEGMENIIMQKCKCGKAYPVFGKETDKKATCCASCKTDEMVNIVCKKCICGKSQPIFGLKDDTSPTCCSVCKKTDMIDIRTKKCNCGKAQPVFGLESDKKATHCSSCKTNEMVNLKARICNCGKSQPFFGMTGDKKATCCSKCKKDGMINIISTKATLRDCKGTFDLQKQGLKCPFDQRGKSKYDYYCSVCFQQNFPLDPRTKIIGSKPDENKIRDFLIDNFVDNPFIHDKPLWTGQPDSTSRRRIDFRALFKNTLLCIKVDDHQYNYKNNEPLKYDDLIMINNGKFIFIRFNPHSYINKYNHKQNPSLESRLLNLFQSINKQMKRIQEEKNTELIEVEDLFFDETV